METHLQVFVGGLLPFASHGLWWWTSEYAGRVEDEAGDDDTVDGVAEDLPVFTRRGLGSGAMWSESDPVCCQT
jgi:hypothetical protein